MKITASLRVTVVLFLAGTSFLALGPRRAFSDPATIVVPDDYSTIQRAVDAAQAGDTILVRNGVYKIPQLTIQKSLKLIAESNATVIDGGVYFQFASNALLQGFSITNGYGIYLYRSSNVEVCDNTIFGNGQGIILLESSQNSLRRNVVVNNDPVSILLSNSSQNKVVENTVMFNGGDGVWLENSTSNIISDNIILRNGLNLSAGFHSYGIRLSYSGGNEIYHNDIVENFEQASGWMSTDNSWDNGYPSGGNYWSDYAGEDADGDGIGDIAYIIDARNIDRYPLMKPIRYILPPPLSTRTLSVVVSGEHDYNEREGIRIRITALVRDADTAEPVSDANVTIEIIDSDGNLWVSAVMTERAVGTGMYEWVSNGTILDMIQENRLKPGIYVAHIKAQAGQSTIASDILQFHVDPPTENLGQSEPQNPDPVLTRISVIAGLLLIAICLIALHKTRVRNAKTRRTLIQLG